MTGKHIIVTHDNNTICISAERFVGEISNITEVMPIAGVAGKAYLASKKNMQTATIVTPFGLEKTNYQSYLEFEYEQGKFLVPADKWETTDKRTNVNSIEDIIMKVFS